MMPSRSTCVPIMKPGTSARNSSGMLKALQVQMKRAALSAEATNNTPPFCLGWLATRPADRAASPQLLGPARLHLEERALVDQPGDQRLHVEWPVLVLGHREAAAGRLAR